MRKRFSVHFHDYSSLNGTHAILSASKYSWLNYDSEKMAATFRTAQAAALGTRLHELAAEHIRLGIRMPRNNATFNRYVNDAIGYRMTPEQVLFYSMNAYGTADAIHFDDKKNFLRIHDLKTGAGRVKMDQLMIYQAFFCLEYHISPFDIESELRIYQNDDVMIHSPEASDIRSIMDRVVEFDQLIESLKEESIG
nr:MAG TPA: Protein of unknown function (DUF2800) [Caudoviricetes sp.]